MTGNQTLRKIDFVTRISAGPTCFFSQQLTGLEFQGWKPTKSAVTPFFKTGLGDFKVFGLPSTNYQISLLLIGLAHFLMLGYEFNRPTDYLRLSTSPNLFIESHLLIAQHQKGKLSVSREVSSASGPRGNGVQPGDLALIQTCSCPDDSLESKRIKLRFPSSIDGSMQGAFLIVPNDPKSEGTHLVVNLHSWSADLNQRSDLEKLVFEKNWYYLFPNFRGSNQRPEACGSNLAQQDILDALDHTLREYSLDPHRVLLSGTSGGGHMTMLMAGLYPERWLAACAWVGISDLSSWHRKHKGSRYGDMIEKCCGGPPGEIPGVDKQYKDRSPIHFIASANDLPIAFFAGIHDGHRGSVPIRHSLDAFNQICIRNGDPVISEKEIQELSSRNGRLKKPQSMDEGYDAAIQRDFYLQRHSRNARVLIFEGGHEEIASGTIHWFEKAVGR